MEMRDLPEGFRQIQSFGLIEAILGRRARRFFRGAEIPDGVLAYQSKYPPLPLTELEKLLVVAACGANTSWHHLIFRARHYAPHLSNYAGAAGGRTFPSAAGFHTSQIFFTDDDGVYMADTRDAPAFMERDAAGSLDMDVILAALKQRTRKVRDGRLGLPAETPHVEPHNTWVVNHPGTLLVTPVGDLAQHVLLALCYLLQNRVVIMDDIHRKAIPGIGKYRRIADTDNAWPLSYMEQASLAELAVEQSASCYAGALMLQAMGLGGWMFDGIDPVSFLGARAPAVPGLGFRYDNDERWPFPNPTGLPGIMEGFCPPHYADMRSAVEAVCERKFGPGGPFHPETPGPWKDSAGVRSAAEAHSEEFRECVALQAQYIYDNFGKFPGTVPSIYVIMHLQAHHLDLEFYDRFFKPGAYLQTHADHMQQWHGGE
jgi:hypothetical protein